nr:hypothetical protein [Tanacetum cinerariifolium]
LLNPTVNVNGIYSPNGVGGTYFATSASRILSFSEPCTDFSDLPEPRTDHYLVHQSLAASHRHVAASYWTATSDVAATSAPINAGHRRSTTVNTAGHRRSTPPATGQRRRITVVIGDQRWRSTMVNAADHRSTLAVNDGRRWRTTVDCRWTTVDHHRTTGQRWLVGRSTIGSGPGPGRVWIGSGPGLGRIWIGSGSGPPRGMPRVSHMCTRVSHVCPRGS